MLLKSMLYMQTTCRWGIIPITWDAGLGVSAALGGDCIYISKCSCVCK